MEKKHSYTGKAMSMPAGIGIGTGASLLISILGAAVMAWLVVSERVGEETIGWGCMVILPLASAAGSILSWNLIRHRRLMVCLIQCAAYYLVLAVMALPFGGEYDGLGVTAVLVVLGGGLTLIPGLMGSKSGVRKYKKAAFR